MLCDVCKATINPMLLVFGVKSGFVGFFNISCLLISQLLKDRRKNGIIIKVVVLVVVAVVVAAGTFGARAVRSVNLSFGVFLGHVLLSNILGFVLSNILSSTFGWVDNRSFNVWNFFSNILIACQLTEKRFVN